MTHFIIHNHIAHDAKLPHAEVQYGKSTGRDHCSVCVHFLAGSHCELVADPIQPNGWCKLFKLGIKGNEDWNAS